MVEDGTQTATGTITFQDVDLIDTHTVSQALTSGTSSVALPGFDPNTQQLGTLTLSPHEDNTDTNNIGTVGWTFTLNNALAQQLAVGQVITQTYTVTIDDAPAARRHRVEPSSVTVTITGTEDAPTITGGDDAGLDIGGGGRGRLAAGDRDDHVPGC